MRTLTMFGFCIVLLAAYYIAGIQGLVFVGFVLLYLTVYKEPKFRTENVLLFENGMRYHWPNNKPDIAVGHQILITHDMSGFVVRIQQSVSMKERLITKVYIVEKPKN